MQSHNIPFIVKSQKETILPADYEEIEPAIEERVRFVQGACLYTICGLGFESLKMIYLHIAYKEQCGEYSQMLVIIIAHSLLWSALALFSIYGINQKRPDLLFIILCLYMVTLVTRILLYYGIEHSMDQLTPMNEYCQYIYQPQSIFLLFLIYFIHSIYLYFKKYVQSGHHLNNHY